MRRWIQCLNLSRSNQAIRFGACFVACMILFHPLSAAISLQDPSPTDITFILVEGNERSSPKEVFIAELYVQAKHIGKGRVHISYSPLTDGTSSVLYQMVGDDDRQIGSGFCAEYEASNQRRRTYRLCSLKALLSRSLREEETQLLSTIILDLSVEL